ncbi:hypothetical protein, partial [Salmonella enterica]|uniref:hypothetical protein n=1 Tax=Salmonella enterica TaxID=28901 RepID=UPI003EDBE1BF
HLDRTALCSAHYLIPTAMLPTRPSAFRLRDSQPDAVVEQGRVGPRLQMLIDTRGVRILHSA